MRIHNNLYYLQTRLACDIVSNSNIFSYFYSKKWVSRSEIERVVSQIEIVKVIFILQLTFVSTMQVKSDQQYFGVMYSCSWYSVNKNGPCMCSLKFPGTPLTVWPSCQIRKIAGAHAPGMPGTFSPSPQVSDPDMHHGTCVTHVPWSLTSSFPWNRRRGKRSRHSRRMPNLQF